MKSILLPMSLAVTMLLSSNMLRAQSSLSLSSATGSPGTAVTLGLTLSGAASPAGMQWTFSYPAASVSSFVVSAGPAATAAGKTVQCSGSSTAYVCVVSGINKNVIAGG